MACRAVTLAASAAVKSGPGVLVAVICKGGSATTTVTVYDNTAASGDKLAELVCAANTSAVFAPAVPVSAARGLYCAISGAGGGATVAYG